MHLPRALAAFQLEAPVSPMASPELGVGAERTWPVSGAELTWVPLSASSELLGSGSPESSQWCQLRLGTPISWAPGSPWIGIQ